MKPRPHLFSWVYSWARPADRSAQARLRGGALSALRPLRPLQADARLCGVTRPVSPDLSGGYFRPGERYGGGLCTLWVPLVHLKSVLLCVAWGRREGWGPGPFQMRDVLLGDGNRPAGGKLLRTDAGAHRSGLRFANILSCPSGTMCPPSGSRADMLRECGVHSSLGLQCPAASPGV